MIAAVLSQVASKQRKGLIRKLFLSYAAEFVLVGSEREDY